MGFFDFAKPKDNTNKDDKKKNKVLQKAQKFARKGQIEKAIAEWKSLLKNKADDATIYNTIGDLYLKGRKREEAVDAYHRASEIFTNTGFSLKAIAVNKKILKLDPQNLDALACMAQLNRERGMANNAKECYLSIAGYHLKTGSHDLALEAYQNIVDMDPANLKIKIGLAELYLKEHMIEEGGRIYGEVVDALLNQNRLDEAEDLCNKGQENHLAPGDITRYMAEIHLARGNIDLAHECCCRLEADASEDHRTALLKAEIMVRKGEIEEGMAQVRSIEPSALTEHDRIKIYRLLLDANELEQAIQVLNDLFDAYAASKRFDELLDLYLPILDRDPDNLRVRQQIIDLLSKLDRKHEVTHHYKEMSRIYADSGDVEKAQNILEKVLELTPGDMEVQTRLRELRGEVPDPGPMDYGEVNLSREDEPVSEEDAGPILVCDAEETGSIETTDAGSDEEVVDLIPNPAGVEQKTFLADNLTEADVYLKYGHLEKAITHLQKNIEKAPDHIETRERLLQIYVERGDIPEQVNTLLTLSRLYQAAGDLEKYDKVLNEVLTLDPENAEAQQKLQQGPTALGSSVPEEVPEPMEDLTFELETEETADAVPVGGTQTGSVEVTEDSIDELIEEADFYHQHGMVEEARSVYENILASHPARADVAEKLSSITGGEVAAVPVVEGTEKAAPEITEIPPAQETDFVDFAEELRREFDTEERDQESGSSGEDDFAAELRREVEQSIVSDAHLFGENDVMNVFNEFREGVQQELGDEDYETHYNLGIAYLEMGLIDEAAEEFVIASGDPKRVMDCITMVGLCYIQKGQYPEALTELEKGLALEGRTDDEYIGVRYEIAKVCELNGDLERAGQELLRIHEVNPRYRDVAQKLKGLGVQSLNVPSVGGAPTKDKKVSYI
ncbi:MAG: hypothetical protein GXP58_06355 [Deltaproteobacteria bacterium]|nr:hypothetical protein [Deltaproteobacteria bacterium]